MKGKIIMRNGLFIDNFGTKRWYKNDLRHKEDGPAVIYPDGAKFWYFEDKIHRTDGPAIIHSDGHKEWHLNGKELTHEKWLAALGKK
jgi:hypothetical protein